MNKFTQNLQLSNKEIKAKRAILIGGDFKDAQEELIKEITGKIRVVERTIMNLEDLSPDSTTSLHPIKIGSEKESAKEWAAKMQEAKIELKTLKIELEVAEETNKEFFLDSVEEKVEV